MRDKHPKSATLVVSIIPPPSNITGHWTHWLFCISFRSFTAVSENNTGLAAGSIFYQCCGLVDRHHYDANMDPDPALYFNADPDPAFHSYADPDPASEYNANPAWIRIHNTVISICEKIKTGDKLDVLGSLVPVAVAGICEALVAVAAGEGPAPGVHDRMLHHVRLGFGHVAAVPALTRGERQVEILL
jgi:hypothetical protein